MDWNTTLSSSTGSGYLSAAIDSTGNVYTVGVIGNNGTYNLGNGVTVKGNYNGSNAILTKYSSSGTTLWSQSTTTASAASIYQSVALDSSGNVYVVGYMNGSSVFGLGNGVSVVEPYSGGSNLVLANYNPSGLAQWAQVPSSASNASAFNGVTIDSSGIVYAVGSITGNAPFQFGSGLNVSGGWSGGKNALIVKYYF